MSMATNQTKGKGAGRSILGEAVLVALAAGWVMGTAAAADFASQVMDATFKYYDPDASGTCFLVRRQPPDTATYLVTAAHVLEETKPPTATLVLRAAQADGTYQRHDYTITIRSGGQPLWVRHAIEDVAVLRLATPLPCAVPALPESALMDEAGFQRSGVHICSPLFVLTYPARVEANDAGFPIARSGIFASPPLLPMPVAADQSAKSTNSPGHLVFLAEFTTFSGDSGAPVFIEGKDGHPFIVGIVLGRMFQDLRHEDEYGEELVHYPLGLGIVLHAQCVRDTLEAAAKAAGTTSK